MKKQYIFITSIIALALVSTSFTSARSMMTLDEDDDNSTSTTSSTSSSIELMKEMRENMKEQIKSITQSAKEKFQQNRERAKEMAEQSREEFKQMMELQREEVKNKIETKREELKTQLKKIKDGKKKTKVEDIDKQLDALNTRLTTHFGDVLDQIQGVLDHIISRTDKAEANGKSVTAVREAIVNAKTSIELARQSVSTQAGKTYSFTISAEENLKSDVGKARKSLHNDLSIVKTAVKTAHQTVKTAATTLAQIPKVNDDEVDDDSENSTSTATTIEINSTTTQ